MRPEGQVIPRAVEVWAAPVESRACARFVASAGAPRYGFEFAAARAYALNNLYSAEFQPGQLVAAPARLIQRSLVVGEHHSGAARGVSRARCTRDADLCGLAAWFSAELGAGHTLTTAPGEPSTVWRQVLLPIEPLAVRAGQTIEIELCFAREPERLFDISWRVDVGDRRAGGSTGASYPTWGPR